MTRGLFANISAGRRGYCCGKPLKEPRTPGNKCAALATPESPWIFHAKLLGASHEFLARKKVIVKVLQEALKFFVIVQYIVLGIAAIPFIYYLLALYSTARFFSAKKRSAANIDFLPPI